VKKLCNSWVAIALLASAPLMTACAERGTDYQGRVNESLKTAELDEVKADWKADEKQLVLSGEVERAADKARAEELAKQVVGTSGRVVNEVKVGTDSQIDARENADDQLEEHLTKSFKEAKEWDMDKLDLNFNVEAGVVTITGDAPSQAVKDRVTAAVKKMQGVKDVVNNLEIK
jgi:osmotically-inducible protein OsmY